MPRDICIVHIEDEFHQMTYLPLRLSQYVRQHLLDNKNGGAWPLVRLDVVASGGEETDRWSVYEVTATPGLGCRVHYIFTAARHVPAEIIDFIAEQPYYIIDVLRPTEAGQGLRSTAIESIKSALDHRGTDTAMTIYTACQGSDLDAILLEYPSVPVISKIGITDLNVLISGIVIKGLGRE